MTVGEVIKINSPGIHKRLMQIGKGNKEPKKRIELGDSPQNLMKVDSYKRARGVLRQKTWG
ncbi:hypothetical protein [Alkaliphilus sp. B6464]|uniref:hypothetical protein n=1 Tax=Alkaliphilus sp. B6464 TaxID=2731219 RepID=UPI001BA486A0|nr:hypothetical protein [Alkaliphilus sp. B6464]QUH21092.1 hypothetical protein HYG84_15195 [Alkaliphilus sp. B6464]